MASTTLWPLHLRGKEEMPPEPTILKMGGNLDQAERVIHFTTIDFYQGK
jgi:hypothetical protein